MSIHPETSLPDFSRLLASWTTRPTGAWPMPHCGRCAFASAAVRLHGRYLCGDCFLDETRRTVDRKLTT